MFKNFWDFGKTKMMSKKVMLKKLRDFWKTKVMLKKMRDFWKTKVMIMNIVIFFEKLKRFLENHEIFKKKIIIKKFLYF